MKLISRTSAVIVAFLQIAGVSRAQQSYRYSTDLTAVKNDQLHVVLKCPRVLASATTFYMPKIVPGNYRNGDYGKFVHDFKAFDSNGAALPVTKLTENSWRIARANTLAKIVYDVEDTFDTTIPNDVFGMSGTNFEEGKNFVLNTCGIYGYLDKMKNLPFELSITKPKGFYGSTGLIPAKSTETLDVYHCRNADHLYDSPIMFCLPDTTTVSVGQTKVLVSVYSPRKLVSSSFIAQNLKGALVATNKYLGGKLPVDKYAFIYYFNGEQKPLKVTGAWEHSYSSFYALAEIPQAQGIASWVDMSSHEFFHIVTPLTVGARQVKEFDFNEPHMSEHLWLYEGTTEYDAHHMQVKYGLNTPQQFLQKLQGKITFSQQKFMDSLSFTELSRESAGKWKGQYENVYMKGALIAACLDLYLLKLSNGAYGLGQLKHDLGVKYGKDTYFNDDELFDVIAQLTYPEIKNFFTTYVTGSTPIPYAQFFDYAGVKYTPKTEYKTFTLGGFLPAVLPNGHLAVFNLDQENEFGKAIGYQAGDELLSLNNQDINAANFNQVVPAFYASAHEGDRVTIRFIRRGADKKTDTITAVQPATKVTKIEWNKLELDPAAGPEKLAIRNAWLGKSDAPAAPAIQASPADVSSIENLVSAVYSVISGPAGDRDWNRFQSLFYPGAYMGATEAGPAGAILHKFTPAEYSKMNGPLLKQYDFTEKEIGRQVQAFGNIAQVFSTYSYTLNMQQPVTQRGINGLQLIKEGGRWWILSLIWDEETKQQPIPAAYLGDN